jgi:vacuolar-type H+-ATPase subunit I/STV1
MKLDNYCPGCGGGAGNQSCVIAKCSLQHGAIEYCYLCSEYPCEKYKGIDEFDSFITHRNQLKDMKKAQRIGIEQYNLELKEKARILKHLLTNYNDGRRKSFFTIAVNLLDLHDLKNIIEQINSKAAYESLTLKEKANVAVIVFQTVAEQKNIVLKLNKKPAKK